MEAEGSSRAPARFVRILFWELVQNLPMVAGFLCGLELWQAGKQGPAIAALLVGSILGSLAIGATESRIVGGHRESLRVVITNVMVIAGLMLVLVVYLSALWSAWWLDLIVGLLGGSALGAVQSLAAGTPVGLRHCAAMALAFALGLVGIRVLSTRLPLPVNIVVLALAATIAISLTDYTSPGATGASGGDIP